MAGTMTTDDLYTTVREMTRLDRETALARLAELVPEHRGALGDVRNRFSAQLHGHSDDYEATAALSLLNRVLATVVPTDRLDWKSRWAKGRKP